LTAIGPMIECGLRPGLLVRSSARRLIGTPGCNSFMKCDQVFVKLTQLQDSIVTIGGNVASNTPSRTVSLLDSITWVRPLPLGTLTGAGPGQPCVELGVPEQVSKATSNRPAAGNCIETGAS
jgi:hypothetical protein